ncbi:NAD(P)/FAD-dependent oxidoreductase [Patescibacteria group bacterium]|nr:NAD(P)/FAD-dependent oxidoreductase [Patescibacteria group bacterium]
MDIDGVTGGYNLTSSWATGRLAGKNVDDNIKR